MWTLTKKILIIGFVLWHAFAVAVYSTPREAQDPIGLWSRLDLIPIVTPYMLSTSQWQLWNLFSPDPLRRVTFYRVETQHEGVWKELVTYKPGSFSIWRHATQFKLYSNMLNEFEQNRAPLAGRFMHLLCAEKGVAAGTPIRLQYIYYVIPFHTQRETYAWWNAWQPQFANYTGFETICPTEQ